MIYRELHNCLKTKAKGFPVITITGPRQSGKTTLAKMTYPDHIYLDLEQIQLRNLLRDDPYAVFNEPKQRYIIDEFQYLPELLSVVKVIVDNSRIPEQFILTGSNQFLMMQNVSQSLAGRTAIFNLLPLTLQEVGSENNNLDLQLFRGSYPRLIADKLDVETFYNGYVSTYLEKDVRQLINVVSIDNFRRFLALCAGRTGCLLNKEALAGETGVDSKTISNWLSVLQASYIIHLLPPYFSNLNKRLVKSPKLYFLDTGLAANLLGIKHEREIILHPLRGQLFETLVVSEVIKFFYNRGMKMGLSFYRETGGTESDLVIEQATQLTLLEIKSAGIVNSSFYKPLHAVRTRFSDKNLDTWLVYSGKEKWHTGPILNLPYTELAGQLESMLSI